MSASPHKPIRWFFRVYNIYTLEKDFVWESGHAIPYDLVFKDRKKRDKVRMIIEKSGRIIIKANYSWDGCTPKFSLFDLAIIGTPDGIRFGREHKPKTYYASLVHDALYQFIPDMPNQNIITRRNADDFFYRILEEHEFALRRLYWLAVRLFGGMFMYTRKKISRRTDGCVEAASAEELMQAPSASMA